MDRINQIKSKMAKIPELHHLCERLVELEDVMTQLQYDLGYIVGGGADLELSSDLQNELEGLEERVIYATTEIFGEPSRE